MTQTAGTHRLYQMRFAALWPAYVTKVTRKGRTGGELEAVTCWLTGHDPASLAAVLDSDTDVAGFFATAPAMNPAREQVTGVICGVRIEQIADPLMREIRILDKLVDELARGRPLAKVLRPPLSPAG